MPTPPPLSASSLRTLRCVAYPSTILSSTCSEVWEMRGDIGCLAYPPTVLSSTYREIWGDLAEHLLRVGGAGPRLLALRKPLRFVQPAHTAEARADLVAQARLPG